MRYLLFNFYNPDNMGYPVFSRLSKKASKKSFLLAVSAVLIFAGNVPCNAKLQGQQLVDSMLQEVAKSKEDTHKVKLLYGLSNILYSSNPDAGIKYGLQSLTLAQKLEWEIGIGKSQYQLATNYCIKSDYKHALECFFAALNIYEQKGYKTGIAATEADIGHVYYAESNYAKALEYELSALKEYEDAGNKKSVSSTLLNIGSIYVDMKNSKKAKEYYFKALKLYEENGNKEGLATTLGNISLVYEQENDHSKALEYDLKALKLYEEGGIMDGVATTLGNMGNVYKAKGEYAAALAYDFRSLRIDEQMGLKDGIAVNTGNIGIGYLAIYKDTANTKPDSLIPGSKTICLKKSIEYLNKGIAVCKEIDYQEGIIEFSGAVSEAYELSGDFERALESYRQYAVTRDTVYSAANKLKITNLETERELSLKDKQIEIDKLAVAKKRNERVFYLSGIGMLLIVIGAVVRNNFSQKKSNQLLTKEKQRSDDLLLNILPSEVADELKATGGAMAKNFDEVTVMFTDFVNFTQASEHLTPQQLIDELHTCFKTFDEITSRYHIEKIKTIGDAYLAVAGMPAPDPNHAANIVNAARRYETL